MNVDEAMAYVKTMKPQSVLTFKYEAVIHTLAGEVERLRAELATANTKTHAERQNRTVEVDGTVRLLKESREEVERLRAELDAAKAETAVPVKFESYVVWRLRRVVVEFKAEADADLFDKWLNERANDTTPPAA